MMHYRTILAAPAICVTLLIGMLAERSTWVTAAQAEPYHAAARAAVNAIPMRIGTWTAVPDKDSIPREAIALLRPNVILCLRYTDTDSANPRQYDRSATLLIDQCKDARDMSGHFPPNCYVNSGQELQQATRRDWTLGRMTIKGTEYEFLQRTATESVRTAVYNFLIVPGERDTLRDMNGVNKAAEDFQRRYFGAAQFQLVMNADLPPAQRDDIFKTLMEPCLPAIRTLMSGGIQ